MPDRSWLAWFSRNDVLGTSMLSVRLLAAGAVLVALAGCSSDSSTSPNGGTQNQNQTPPLAQSPLAVATWYSCFLAPSGQAYCWGSNQFGALGASDSRTRDSLPELVAGGPYVALSTTDFTSCALTATGAAFCWGRIPQLDVSTPLSSPVPLAQSSAPVPLVRISAGSGYACGLDASGAAYCWGNGDWGKLGTGDAFSRTVPTPVAGGLKFKSIGASFTTTCGLATSGAAYCWGLNYEGGLGIGNSDTLPQYELSPTAVAGGLTFASLSVGTNTSCGVTSDGAGYCWGSSVGGEIGDGDTSTAYTPTFMSGPLHFKSITPGRVNNNYQSTCGITTDGTAYCWGLNDRSQLGSAATSQCQPITGLTTGLCNLTPTPVAGLGAVLAIDPGIDHSCALTTTNQVVCWGNNTRGQLGDGTLTTRAAPAPVVGLPSTP